VAKEVNSVSSFYGQELNRTTYNLARMNMILHGVHYRKFDIRQEDTLERPQHLDLRFEAIVANPPFSAKWSANPIHMSDDRFSQYGKLAPKSKADFAFIQHMIYQLDENGQMAVVLPHGALFRGGAEGHIRQYLIEDRNYLDAVIGLPPNIFYGTSFLPVSWSLRNAESIRRISFSSMRADENTTKRAPTRIIAEEDIERIVHDLPPRETKVAEKIQLRGPLGRSEGERLQPQHPTATWIPFEEEEPVDLAAVSKVLAKRLMLLFQLHSMKNIEKNTPSPR
jgi:type I restriction enzyme M protein